MQFIRELRRGMRGPDVLAVKRALRKAGFRKGLTLNPTFGTALERQIKAFQHKHGLKPDGVYGPSTHKALAKYFDRYGKLLYKRTPKPPALVEPNQGWSSLSKTLWQAYSLCRNSGSSFIDLGTYNPASRLPSGAPSDHAVYPAMAFDIGIEPDTGWNNLKARALAMRLVRLPEVEYVILGNRIWTDWRKFWGSYTSGGHQNHIHVSGRR